MNALSLFSGCGGLDIGVETAGFNIISSIELDKNAAESLDNWYRQNNKNTKVLNADINTVNPADYKRDKITLLFGGPPCQAFSLAGKRESLGDDRGVLLYQMVRFAKELLPKVILIEQVKGLLSAPDELGIKGGAFKRLIDEISGLGYTVNWSVLCAADYGVPQVRERLFIVAFKGKKRFVFPAPTHSEDEEDLSIFPLKKYVGIGKVISGLPKPTRKGDVENYPNHVDVTPEREVQRISYVREGGYLAGEDAAPRDIVMKLTKKDTTKFKRLHREMPSLTLRGGEIFFHPTENRYLTPREYLRIHTYPESYVLKGPVRARSGNIRDLDQHRQIANSVPPKLAEIVALEVMRQLQ